MGIVHCPYCDRDIEIPEIGELPSITDEQGMATYTKWCLAHPWHSTKEMPAPPDCDCKYCVEKRAKERQSVERTKTNHNR